MKNKINKIDKVDLKLPRSSKVSSYSDELGAKSADALKESLTAMKEVREELKEVYSENKKIKEELNKANNKINSFKVNYDNAVKKTEKLSAELTKYKKQDEEKEAKLKTKRLEKLSKQFEMIGRKKTVEELSSLPDAVLSEFENITSAAIDSSKQGVVDIIPSQSQSDTVKKSESLSEGKGKESKSFAESICETLTTQQVDSGKAGKRIKFL